MNSENIDNNSMQQELRLRTWLSSWPNILTEYDHFSVKLQRREIYSAYDGADKTLKLLLKILDVGDLTNFDDFADNLRLLGYCLLKKQPMALSIGSVILRFIYIIDEQSMEAYKEITKPSVSNTLELSLSSILAAPISKKSVFNIIKDMSDLKACIRESVSEEIQYDIEEASTSICKYSEHYINYGEVILTYSKSRAVSDFLGATLSAGVRKNIDVICCETFPSLSGQEFVMELARMGLKTSLIHDAAVFTVMSRCNKVIIGCHAVLANGGVLVPSGGSNIVMAAAQFKVPVIVLSGMYKLCPQFCSDQSTINDMASPNKVIPYSLCDAELSEVDVVNPVYDYIPPEYITLILTTKGGFAPSYIFRLMKECYSNQDMLKPLNLRSNK